MFEPLEKVLVNSYWNELLAKIDKETDPDYYEFCGIFNKDIKLSSIISCLDIELYKLAKSKGRQNDGIFYGSIAQPLFKPEHVKLWEDVDIILNVLFYNSEPLLIDFFLFDMEKKLKKDYSQMGDINIKKIIELIESTINSYLIT
jgi:hypothetical protein